ncbi:hypothetical protein NDI47_10580 [Microcoleus vaginatus GB1-A2]|uniref:hypothetical protein n=1 Tax=Microcoleus vaginatus TaxID=119532 RepID=UPI0032AA3A60
MSNKVSAISDRTRDRVISSSNPVDFTCYPKSGDGSAVSLQLMRGWLHPIEGDSPEPSPVLRRFGVGKRHCPLVST